MRTFLVLAFFAVMVLMLIGMLAGYGNLASDPCIGSDFYSQCADYRDNGVTLR